MDREIVHIKAELVEIKKVLEKIDQSIRGNGQPGLKTRVEILEKDNSRVSWALRVLFTSVVGGAAAAVKYLGGL